MVLVHVDAEMIGGKECDSCVGRLDGIWPVIAMESGRGERAYA